MPPSPELGMAREVGVEANDVDPEEDHRENIAVTNRLGESVSD